MSKRTQPRKLRDRRSGRSPYARYGKVEQRYSSSYYAWFEEVTGSRHRSDRGTPSYKKAA